MIVIIINDYRRNVTFVFSTACVQFINKCLVFCSHRRIWRLTNELLPPVKEWSNSFDCLNEPDDIASINIYEPDDTVSHVRARGMHVARERRDTDSRQSTNSKSNTYKVCLKHKRTTSTTITSAQSASMRRLRNCCSRARKHANTTRRQFR